MAAVTLPGVILPLIFVLLATVAGGMLFVGSGYGGAIAACRLARAGRSVCVLERGRERHPGEFPDHLVDAARQTQTHFGGNHVGPRTGLYDFHLGRDISVVVGCGLGGTSLINANVALAAGTTTWSGVCHPSCSAVSKASVFEPSA